MREWTVRTKQKNTVVKKALALALALLLLLSLAGCGSSGVAGGAGTSVPAAADPVTDATPTAADLAGGQSIENKVILGDGEMLAGDFRYPGLGNRYPSPVNRRCAESADLAVHSLISGYAAMESDQNGTYQWNATAVKAHSLAENPDGTATLRVEIDRGLTYSDGTPITVKDYLARLLAFSTQAAADAEASGLEGQRFVGFAAFRAYLGDNDGQRADGVTASKVFSGVHMVDAYTYELTISADFYPDYYAEARACLQPDPPAMWLGEGVDILDDGAGCYLSDTFYTKKGDSFEVTRTITRNSYDKTTFPFSGPYTVAEWDKDARQVTLQRNPAYKGNFEGQRPSIETIVYVYLDEREHLGERQKARLLELLQSGELDVLRPGPGSGRVNATLALADGEHFAAGSYQYAGYGKLDFACDLGPAMFAEVRQALAYLLDREAFRQNYLEGNGVIIHAPYSPGFAAWQAVKDDIELNDYAYSPETAKKLLEEGGWIYNSKGEPYQAGAGGVDAVRYKKLTEAEANALDGANKTYASAANTDGIVYQTVEIGGEYYMPLVLNWLATESYVTDYLALTMAYDPEIAAAGMLIRSTNCDNYTLWGTVNRDLSWNAKGAIYSGVLTYNMFSMTEEWSGPIYDYSYCWSTDPAYDAYSANHLQDPYDLAFPYDPAAEKLTYAQAMQASGGQLGMDYLSMAMIHNARTEEEYDRWWMAYIQRWNQLLPAIPLYSNVYYYVYNTKLENFVLTPFFGQERAILYANVKGC